MRRREFLLATAGCAFAIQPGSVLVHEHVLVDFVGADQIGRGGTTATRFSHCAAEARRIETVGLRTTARLYAQFPG